MNELKGYKKYGLREVVDFEKIDPFFCQLNELTANSKKLRVWKEAARWLKFVEVVENSGRWSKPHVATISLESLIDLRKLISDCALFLNSNPKSFKNLIDEVVNNLIKENQLEEINRHILTKTLLLSHVHQYQNEFEKQLEVRDKKKLKKNYKLRDINEKKTKTENCQEKFKSEISQESSSDKEISVNQTSIEKTPNRFIRKIPKGSKAANVLIGEVDFLKEELAVLIRFSEPILFKNLTEVPAPTKYIFILLGPTGHLEKIRKIGFSISTLFSDGLFQHDINNATEKIDIITAIDDFLDQTTLIPPSQWNTNVRLAPPDKTPTIEERLMVKMIDMNKDMNDLGSHEDDPCLKRTGRFCGGLIDDLKRKIPWYLSDFTDAFNFQCIPAIAFLYFACLSPIITFGSLLGYATDQNMGAIESLLSGLICGVSYSLFSGQPITILGSTGPVLVFEAILNSFSKAYGIDYIGFRCWVGLWVTLFLLIISITDLSFLVKYITRFTEELFAMLIALIFVNESIDKLLKIRSTHNYTNKPYLYKIDFNSNSSRCFRCMPKNATIEKHIFNETFISENDCKNLGKDFVYLKNCDYIPDVFFFSVSLYLGTFFMAMSLRKIKFSSFFPSKVRILLSNFGVIITIATMVLIDYSIGLDTPKLHVPAEFQTTLPERGWFINPLERNKGKYWLIVAAIVPALLATILIFMDQHITVIIINRKENKLRKSGGYHLDLFVCAICIGVNSFFGLPWFVAATVLSMNHIIALRKTSESTVPGEIPKIVGVIEQRVTGVVVFVLIGCSIFATRILAFIPMAVLYAIFMYMGVTPMGELEFFQRILLLFIPKKHQPDLKFLRHVRLQKVHLFTIIQLICLAILFILKLNKKISITFPLMVLALVFIRFGLSYVFTEKELSYLDDILPGSWELKENKKMHVNEIDVELLEESKMEEANFKTKELSRLKANSDMNQNKVIKLESIDEV